MPHSKPANFTAPVQQAAPPKKNTVDYIPSKIGYETAIPVSIFADRRDFLDKCKPYDIIDGPNPLDDGVDDPTHSTTTSTASPALEGVKAELKAGRDSRKRSRSPLKGGAAKLGAVKSEVHEETTTASLSLTFTRPKLSGWAAEQLRDGRPYQLLRSRDMEMRVRYVLDDHDYEWCAVHSFSPQVVQRGITYLEWAYVSSLIAAATPHVEQPMVPDASALLASNGASESGSVAVSAAASGSPSPAVYNNGAQGASGGADVSSPTTAALHHFSSARRHSERGRGAAAGASTFPCALCSKRVHLLSDTSEADGHAERGGATSCAGTRGASLGSRGGRSREAQGRRTSLAAARSPRGGAAPARGAAGTFSSHDLQHQGLRCCDCGVIAHLRCWFLTEAPRQPETWRCDGCTKYAQHRKRSAGVCCMCGRMGGVLLPYVSSVAVREEGEGGHAGSSGDPSSPLHNHAHGVFSSSLVASADMVCHAVCALSMSELAIHPRQTTFRRNGTVDMEERPYVYALRRVGKQKYAMHCVFCEHGGTGRCVQCHHPHCFEAMHASCAAEAHTVDCHTDTAVPPAAVPGSHHPRPLADGTATTSSVVGAAGAEWLSCSTYCRKHYGYSVSNAVGSAALGEKAEADALALDLTGLLTGDEGVTSPVVRKRGRGRPPVALVQQREAERDLIMKLHAYWLERREHRRRSSGQLVSEVNARLRPVVAAMLRPEIVKVSADKVRLSHFLSLVPEWQWQLVAVVEGELPLPDEEYDEVQKYRKAAHTRRSGNTRSLYDRMCIALTQLDLMCRITANLKQECQLRRTSAELEVEALRLLCSWR